MAVPAVRADTTPDEFTDAMDGALELQVPNAVASVNVSDVLLHIAAVPEIADGVAGTGLMVIVSVPDVFVRPVAVQVVVTL